jgi:glycosyltransferase involved in cell wall biosynthesis
MRIGIEAERANFANPTGAEHYAKQLILALAEIDQENEYILYLRTQPLDWFKKLPPNFKLKVIPFPIFWTQLRISWEMLWHRTDALLIMASALPLIHPKNSVVTIHDLGYIFYPETYTKFQLHYLELSNRYIGKFARKIIAISEDVKKDILEQYHFNPRKIEVVHHGFNMENEHDRVSSPEELQKIATLPEKFVLALSTLQPKKNVIGLIDAFIELKKEKQIPHSLVLVGGKGWMYDEIMAKIADHPEVIYMGYIQDRFKVLDKASALVQPSFFEGFGMQILDAFAAGVPIASSNASSLPEIGGDAAIYFDPRNKEEMKASLYRIVTDEDLRKELVAKGHERLKQFTWRSCAEKTLKVITGK